MKEMGKRLKGLRESMGLSQMKWRRFGIWKQPAIIRYEQGTATPTVENLRKYADYFDVSMDYIFARTDRSGGKLMMITSYFSDLIAATSFSQTSGALISGCRS